MSFKKKYKKTVILSMLMVFLGSSELCFADQSVGEGATKPSNSNSGGFSSNGGGGSSSNGTSGGGNSNGDIIESDGIIWGDIGNGEFGVLGGTPNSGVLYSGDKKDYLVQQ